MADSTVGYPLGTCIGACDFAGDAPEVSADEQLIEGLRTGAEDAYETLISRFQQPVYGIVLRLMADPSEACDVVQEVFVKIFRNINGFRGDSSLKTWIYRIAVNEAHNHRRWFGRHRRQEVGLEGEEGNSRGYQDTLSDPGTSPFDAALSHEQRALIESALAGLGPVFRSAVILRDIEDLSYEEIAAVLQVNLGTVKSRILRGREALRKKLTGRLEPGPALTWAAQTGRVELGSIKP